VLCNVYTVISKQKIYFLLTHPNSYIRCGDVINVIVKTCTPPCCRYTKCLHTES